MKLSTDKTAPRPSVNKLKPLKQSNRPLNGPDWSGFLTLFEDPEWLSQYNKVDPADRKSQAESKKGDYNNL